MLSHAIHRGLAAGLPSSRWEYLDRRDGKRGVGGNISQDGHRCELRIGGSRELNRRAKRTLRLRQIIQCDNDLGKHKRLERNGHGLYRMSPTRAVAITCFW